MYLIIDVGNTSIKWAVFSADKIIFYAKVDAKDFDQTIENIHEKYDIQKAIWSAVGKLSGSQKEKIKQLFSGIELTHETKLPFLNLYETPHSLGVDRIALATAAVSQFPQEHVLVIDAGTCVTYDFLNDQKAYKGGAISPGIRSRYRSLHDYTEGLPLLDLKAPKNFIGNNTQESIHSGIVNGLVQEIEGVITQYKITYKKLTVVLTGGDAEFLAKQLKSSIFVRPFFLLEGLYSILKFNIV